MKVYRVVVQMPDGPMRKRKGRGGREQPLIEETSLYAASSIERVWAEVAELMRGPYAEGTLLTVEEAAPAIFILDDPPPAT